jgi:hypothetical protein
VSDVNRKSFMTLAEHDAQMKAEGKWDEVQARLAERQAERDRHWAQLDAYAAPLQQSLHAIDPSIHHWRSLAQKPELSDAVIRVLLEHAVRSDYPEQVKEIVLRSLARPEARPHWSRLVEIFEKNLAGLIDPRFSAQPGFTLAQVADESVMEDVYRLLKNRAFGANRLGLLIPLYRSKSPRSKMVLMELKDDPDLTLEIKRGRRMARKGKLDL